MFDLTSSNSRYHFEGMKIFSLVSVSGSADYIVYSMVRESEKMYVVGIFDSHNFFRAIVNVDYNRMMLQIL
jgi:hypothetical protein